MQVSITFLNKYVGKYLILATITDKTRFSSFLFLNMCLVLFDILKKGEGQIGSEKYPYLWSEENS